MNLLLPPLSDIDLNKFSHEKINNTFLLPEKINHHFHGIFFVSTLVSIKDTRWFNDFIFLIKNQPFPKAENKKNIASLYIQKLYSRNFPILTILNFQFETFGPSDFKNYFDRLF